MYEKAKLNCLRKRYIQELAYFLDTVPFVFLTIIVDKEKMLKNISDIQRGQPWGTTIGEAQKIFAKAKKDKTSFKETKMGDIINIISQYKVLPIDHFRPLKIAYRELLEQYFKNYQYNIYTTGSKMQICVESSEYQSRILKYTEEFLLETDKVQPKPKRTKFSRKLKNSMYSLSFPNKKAKFLGLEIADIISYGYYLSSHHRRCKNELYKDVWKVIEKRKKDIEQKYQITCVIRM